MSRFGPPIVKESAEPTHSQRNASLESLRCDPLPENSSRATPPPLSRESSMTSICGAAGQSGLPTHLPPRPQSPPRGYRYRTEDDSQGQHCNRVQSSVDYSRRRDDADMEPPPRQRPATQTPKRRTMDSYVPEPPPPSRDTYITEPLRASFQDTRGDHYIAQPAPMTQDEELGRAPSAMHPERALMLQPNGLPPRPSSALGRAGRGSKRERREDRERAETLWGNGSRRFASASPGGGEKRRYPRTEGGAVAQGGGASLLDRLTLDDGGLHKSPSLRDRVQLPSKRDREEMLAGDVSMNQDVDEGSKRLRRRGMKSRKGRR
ncbi:hypothetical protein BS17DRAFT_535033 [Gyrodon lividus]|nr:hypothetical protein BS17DRAFT_535033 [Gyrodon lividus]